MRVAVIGTGIAGNAAAWALSKRYTVSVYERELRPGGHSHTITIDYDGTPLAVDIGFIVYNELNYPGLTALFAELGVETTATSMSFAVSADAGRFEWKGDGTNWREILSGLFVQPRNLFSLSYLRMLRDVLRFNTQSVEDYAAGRLAGLTLGEYFADRKFAPRLLSDYLAPMGAAIWSGAGRQDAGLPCRELHRLLQQPPPAAIRSPGLAYGHGRQPALCGETDFRVPRPDQARLRRDVYPAHAAGCRRQRQPRRQRELRQCGDRDDSDQALAMLSDADNRERAILGAVGYATNTIYLHRDTRLMPVRRQAWASWNFLRWQRAVTPGTKSRRPTG